jgi:hypothetical protein
MFTGQLRPQSEPTTQSDLMLMVTTTKIKTEEIFFTNVQESTKEECLEQIWKPAIVGNMEAK